MDNIWAKIAAVAVLVVVVLVVMSKFSGPKEEQPVEEERGFRHVIEEDDQRLRAEPEAVEDEEGETVELEFEALSQEDEIQASKLFEMAITHRKMGRLPVVGYGQMVDYCRQIIEKWPRSAYAYKARRMLGDIPKSYWKRYKITEEEIAGDN